MAELKTYKQKVFSVMEEHEEARNNDGTLLAYFIDRFFPQLVIPDADGEKAIKLRNLKNLPPLENIRRVRAIIQNVDGKLLPTKPEVIKARKIKEENFRNVEVREANQFKPYGAGNS